MKIKYFNKYAGLGLLMFAFFNFACNNQKHVHSDDEQKNEQTHTCPMHPQIIQNAPGSCPICSMDLVPFEKTDNAQALNIDKTRQALANITTMAIGVEGLVNQKRLNGRLVTNPESNYFISSRIAGRIEQLSIRETGVAINKGQAIYRIYSEQLSVLQQEYLLTIMQVQQFPGDEKYQQLAEAAKQKLLLLGQSQEQIRSLAKDKKTDPYVTYYSPTSGVITELFVSEGQYVEEGSPIFHLEDYSSLWVEADLYAMEGKDIKVGQQVKVSVAGWEGEPQTMEIRFINPSFKSNSQLLQIRGTISNPTNQWQPGLQATIFLPLASHGEVLSLPTDAIIRIENGNHVWVKTGEDTFEPRDVKLGMENLNHTEISAGLREGDKVVITGAYLLYSEFVLKSGKQPQIAYQ